MLRYYYRAVSRLACLLPAGYQRQILPTIARNAGAQSIGCSGELGWFQGDVRDATILASYREHGTWAPDVQAILATLLQNGGTLFDVGANVGLVSIPAAKLARVYAFEPDPDNHRYLISNIAANGAVRVTAFPVALGAADGEMELEKSPDNMGDHRLRVSNAGGAFRENRRDTVKVQVRRLDSIVHEPMESPVVLKCDTQGAEVRVLAGAIGTLSKVDFAILEFWPYGLARMGDSSEAFWEAISMFPFGALLDERVGSIPPLVSIADLAKDLRSRIPSGSTDHVDVFLSRTESFVTRV